MSNVSVEVHGKRHNVHVSPMAPLSAVIAAALAAEGISADPAACKLLLGKKELEAGTPLRFANIPTGAKLQLVTGHERRLGLGEPIAAPRLPGSPKKAATSPQAAAAASAPYTMAPSSKQLSSGAGSSQIYAAAAGDGLAAENSAAPASPSAAAASAPPAAATQGAAPQQQQAAAAQQPASTSGNGDGASPIETSMETAAAPAQSGAVAAQPSVDAAAGSSLPDADAADDGASAAGGVPQPDPQSVQLLGRPAYVFSRAAAQEAEAAATSVDDPPDSFYEFTADDYFRVARGWGANFATGPAASAPLKTGRVRAAEAAAAAAKIGPVPVRVLGFSEGMALQATFAATDPVSALQEMVEKAVLPNTAGLHLYTAPPKAVLQQPQASLFEADLAPAAVVYVSCDGDGNPMLRPEVLAMQGLPPPRERRPRGSKNGQKQVAAAAGPDGEAGTPQQGGILAGAAQEAPRTASGAKLPKWLKPKK